MLPYPVMMMTTTSGLISFARSNTCMSVQVGHLEIGDHNIDLAVIEQVQGFSAVVRYDCRHAILLQDIADELGHAGVVIEHQGGNSFHVSLSNGEIKWRRASI